MLIVFEDVHWIDPTTQELLDFAIERVPALPVLLMITFRPEFEPPWHGRPSVSELALHRPTRHRSSPWSAGSPAARCCRPRCSTRSSPRPTACPCSSRS